MASFQPLVLQKQSATPAGQGVVIVVISPFSAWSPSRLFFEKRAPLRRLCVAVKALLL
jgi:hypothetical protein